jgi:hypothetical protein
MATPQKERRVSGINAGSEDIQWHNRKSSKVVSATKASRKGEEQMHSNDDDDDLVAGDKEIVAVFNSNTPDGSSVVRALSKSGVTVVAIVRVFTSKNTKALLQIPNVTVKVADTLDAEAVENALKGVHRAFLCLGKWESYESRIEQEQATLILQSCAAVKVPHLVFSTFEDTAQLRKKGEKSQIVPDAQGRIRPKFKEMKELNREARNKGVQLTHMITSYLDQETSKKSLCLIMGENGRLIVQPHMMDT